MRVVRALLLAAGTAIAAALLAAVVLAIVGLYEGGHGGRAWTDAPVVDRGSVHLAVADVVLLGVAAAAGAAAFVAALRG